MWLLKFFAALCFAAVCAAGESESVTESPTDDLSTFPVPGITTENVPVPPAPSLQLQSSWLAVFPSENVILNCSLDSSSDWTITWFRGGEEVPQSDPTMGIQLSGDRAVLTITAVLNRNSGSYTCKGRHNTKGITTASSNSKEITIYKDNPKLTLSGGPDFSPMYPGESVTFSCKVSVGSEWEYLWYFNSLQIPGQNSETYTIGSISISDNGLYHCKAKRGPVQFPTEESQPVTLQVSGLPKTVLSLMTPWHDVFENEAVGFHCNCSCDTYDWTFSWYRNQKLLQGDADQNLEIEESGLNITSVTKAHAGRYTCRVSLESRGVRSQISNTVTVKVYDNIPKPTISKVPALNPMYVGETVDFTCRVDVGTDWVYLWKKDGEYHPETSSTISIRLDSPRQVKYSCEATRGETTTTPASDELAQDVVEIPVPSSKQETQWLDVYPDESVKLSCAMGNGVDWTYTWFKDGREVQTENTVTFSPNGAMLSIRSASAAHAGQYNCKGNLKGRSVKSTFSSGISLTVYGEKPRIALTQDPDYTPMFSGESVSFACHVNGSGFEYLWFKDGQKLDVFGNNYALSSVVITARGSYTCQAKRGPSPEFFTDISSPVHFDVRDVKPKPTMTQQPGFNELYTGESVTFTCGVAVSSGWEYLWYKDGVQHSVGSGDSSFHISNVNLSNSGSYECMAKRHRTSYETQRSDKRILRVSEIPVPSLTQVTQWLDVFPTETVKLHCKMKNISEWTYTWYKDEQKVQAENMVHLDQSTATLSINATVSYSGNYKCSGKLKGRSVYSNRTSELQLSVYDAKPTVTVVQNPSHISIYSGDSVSFSCHINVSNGWEYLWYKNDIQLVAVTGNSHNIPSVLTKDSGLYRCQTKRGNPFKSEPSQAVELAVKERPQADIVLLTGWSEVFSTDSLVLKCGVKDSPDSWNYTWFKESQQIPSEASERHIVTPESNPDQSEYSCQGIRIGNPSYSKTSENFKTKNLLLKRRVLLAISGCIVFGIAAVILGCIVLRIFRKPVKEEYKPEEGDLFVSMARQKDGNDTSCPLVQFITDAALNSPPKEEEENGMICSEATPLPITTQEDQAVTTEDPGASETNGGLVSFKQ